MQCVQLTFIRFALYFRLYLDFFSYHVLLNVDDVRQIDKNRFHNFSNTKLLRRVLKELITTC